MFLIQVSIALVSFVCFQFYSWPDIISFSLLKHLFYSPAFLTEPISAYLFQFCAFRVTPLYVSFQRLCPSFLGFGQLLQWCSILPIGVDEWRMYLCGLVFRRIKIIHSLMLL